jgi:hypothetical protein
VLLLALAAGCSSGSAVSSGSAPPSPSVSSAPAPTAPAPVPTHSVAPSRKPSPSAPASPSWTVGASPLPLRADGFGQVLPTPEALRNRRLQAPDLLPPPADGRFHATVQRIDPRTRRTMGESWSPRCPVGLDDLRLLTMGFRGFDGRAHTGRMVVNASVADQVVEIFRTLFRIRFPIEEMRLVTTGDLEAKPTGDGNNTAAFVCRATRRQTTWSAHAYGLAIDLDPFQNPYHSGDPGDQLVLPELASAYLDRSWRRPGMVEPGDAVTRAFADAGWTWGGDFRSVKDLMHFSATGR